jgi:signal peptidase II
MIKNFLYITYVQNTGVAFGFFRDQRVPLLIIGFIVCAIVMYFYLHTRKKDPMVTTALAFIMGGSLGNLYDRLFHGFVIDYIDFRFFPVFNLADISINIGVALIICAVLIKGAECIQ